MTLRSILVYLGLRRSIQCKYHVPNSIQNVWIFLQIGKQTSIRSISLNISNKNTESCESYLYQAPQLSTPDLHQICLDPWIISHTKLHSARVPQYCFTSTSCLPTTVPGISPGPRCSDSWLHWWPCRVHSWVVFEFDRQKFGSQIFKAHKVWTFLVIFQHLILLAMILRCPENVSEKFQNENCEMINTIPRTPHTNNAFRMIASQNTSFQRCASKPLKKFETHNMYMTALTNFQKKKKQLFKGKGTFTRLCLTIKPAQLVAVYK